MFQNASNNDAKRNRFASTSAAIHPASLHKSETTWAKSPIRRNIPGRGSDKRHDRGVTAYKRPVSYVDLLSSPVKDHANNVFSQV